MITEEEIDAAIAIMEDSTADPFDRATAALLAEAYIRQEERTLAWMRDCYFCRDLARMAEQRYGNRATRAR